ncbi:immunity 26/phosphotriesterase HocA family protein [Hymenobacter sp. DG25B]|uniref:immunity 26/phosphotriesterase HocA family protein n=1 Tax=Hymenobacter sp. DG25B TaxID=1385664 RepID=UPI0008141D7A|nr:immunity 26/phosphotriesterase HocA family protein [Hymenobacter sp. DG25B]
MTRQRRTIGAVVEINLLNGYYGYGRIVGDASFAIYDLYIPHPLTNLEQIIERPILFIVAVYDDAVTSGRWRKVGSAPLPAMLRTLPLKFIQDALKPESFSLYDPNTGEITPATKETCKGLERASVWEAEHVEERIRDHYAHRPNQYRQEDVAVFE